MDRKREGEEAERMPRLEPGARNATLIFSSGEMNAKIDPVNLRVRFIEERWPSLRRAMKARGHRETRGGRGWREGVMYLCHGTSAVAATERDS